MQDILTKLLGADTPGNALTLHQIAARAVVVYVVGVVIVRVGKSRLIGRTTPLDIILGFILGSLLSRGITGHATILGTTVATVVLVGVHWCFTAIAFRSHWFGTLIKGNVHPVIENGILCADNMRRSHISIDDLMEELRLHGVSRLDLVASAYKERNGEISVIKKETHD